MLDFKETYKAILTEKRHRHEIIWKVRQLFITIVLAVILILPKFGTPSTGQIIGLSSVLVGSTILMIIVDLRYQRKKISFLKQLNSLEKHLKIKSKWRLGNQNEKIGYFYLSYLIIAVAGLIAFLSPIVLNNVK